MDLDDLQIDVSAEEELGMQFYKVILWGWAMWDLLYTATCTKKHDPAPFVSYIMYVSQNLEHMIWKEGFKEQFVQLRIFILGHYVELAALFCPF
jgi:hypothetical protein